MKKVIAMLLSFFVLFAFSASADSPSYLGTWTCVFNVSDDSTTFVMFQLREDHTVLYMNQFFYMDHPGMTEKGVWTWEEISDRFFRIITGDNRMLYFELTDQGYLSAGNDLYYTRRATPEGT